MSWVVPGCTSTKNQAPTTCRGLRVSYVPYACEGISWFCQVPILHDILRSSEKRPERAPKSQSWPEYKGSLKEVSF